MDGVRCNYHTFSISGTVFEVDVRYTNLRAVGSGSYGLVCAADDTITGNKVAIKKGPSHHAPSETVVTFSMVDRAPPRTHHIAHG